MIALPFSPQDTRLEFGVAPWRAWERTVLHDLIGPADGVLELRAGACGLTTTLAARAGWVTAVEEHPDRLAHLREHIAHSGWPNITLVPRLSDARASGPFDVVAAPWLASDAPNLRWLSRLAEWRLILTCLLDDAALDELRTAAQSLGLDVTLHAARFGAAGLRAVLAIDLESARRR